MKKKRAYEVSNFDKSAFYDLIRHRLTIDAKSASDSCWLWSLRQKKPTFTVPSSLLTTKHGARVDPTRFAWAIHHGQHPTDLGSHLRLLRTCGTRGCIRPDHHIVGETPNSIPLWKVLEIYDMRPSPYPPPCYKDYYRLRLRIANQQDISLGTLGEIWGRRRRFEKLLAEYRPE